MSDGYIKLFSSILDSSLWGLQSDAKVVFITLLGMADPDGVVRAAIPGIARRANVSLEATREAMALFQEPDPDSRDPSEDGRRVLKVEDGWLLVTYQTYRERKPRSQQLAEERVRRHRDKKKEAQAQGEAQVREQVQGELQRSATLCNALQREVTPGNAPQRPKTAEAEADKEAEEEADTDNRRSASVSAFSSAVDSLVGDGDAYRKQLWTRLVRVVMHRDGEDPAGRDPPGYRAWWRETSVRVVDAGGIGEMEGWVAYCEDCLDEGKRSAKALGEMRPPAKWVAKQCKLYLKQHGKSLPQKPVVNA